jgi:D-xylose transport system substrate-binding protein
MLVRTGNKIDAVAAANDGLGNAVVTALKAKKLDPIPVSGQDATAGGVQNVISGWQSGTVYKSIKLEAEAAAQVAINIIKGKAVKTNGTTNDGKRNVPSILLKPVWVTKANYNVLFAEGFLKKPSLPAVRGTAGRSEKTGTKAPRRPVPGCGRSRWPGWHPS